MTAINWRTLGSSMVDTSQAPDVEITRVDGLSTVVVGESVMIRSTFTKEVRGFGGGIVFFTDSQDQDGGTEAVSGAFTPGTVYEQQVNLPQGSRGTFEYFITANSVYDGSKYGPPATRSIVVAYNTEVPDVQLSRPLQNTEREAAVLVTAKWNHAVIDFAEGDLTQSWAAAPGMLEGSIDQFAGSGDTYTFRVNIPANVAGEVVITVPSGSGTSVIDPTKDGPPMARSIRIPFDRTAGDVMVVPDPATLTISKPLAPTYGIARYTTTFRWSRPVTGFTAADVDVTIASGSGTAVKGTLVADTDTPGVYRMQLTLTGSGRVRVEVDADSALAGTVESPENDVFVEWDFAVTSVSRTTSPGATELCSETFTIDAHPYLNDAISSRSSDGAAGGAFFGVSDLIEHNGKVYGVVQIRKRAEGSVNELSIVEQAGAVLFMVDRDGCRVLKAYPFVTRAARSLVVHDDAVHFFEGSHYQYYDNWIPRTIPGLKEVGYVHRIDKDSNAITEVGLNWRSVLPSTPEGRVDGLHGGTATPMLSTPDGLQVVAGWGSLDNVTQGLDPNTSRFPISTDIENWQWVEQNSVLDFIVSQLQTNGKRAWTVLEELARICNCVIGYTAGRFIFESREPRKCRLNAPIAATGAITTIDYTQANRTFPDAGKLYIDGELFSYTGRTATQFTGVTRSIERTQASAHEGSDIYFVHAVLDSTAYAEPINDLSLRVDTTRVYNEIVVTYGDTIRGEPRKAVARSQSSIQLHGKQSFELPTTLDHHQVQWAEWLAERLLAYFSDEHLEMTLGLQHTAHVGLTDVVYVHEPDRTGVAHLAQIQGMGYDYAGKTTEMRVRTV